VSLDAGYFSAANVTAIAALGCTPLIPPDRQLHGRAVPAAPRGRPPAGLSVAAHPPDQARSAAVCSAQDHRGAGLWADQAGARLPPVCVARDVQGPGGMGAHLYNPQCAEALAGLAAPTPTTWAVRAGGPQQGGADSQEVAGLSSASQRSGRQNGNQQSESWPSFINVGQAPREI
jgi:hypothetical protein